VGVEVAVGVGVGVRVGVRRGLGLAGWASPANEGDEVGGWGALAAMLGSAMRDSNPIAKANTTAA
jgi:hypothetical protein